ncbi:MAG: hypothetical protein LBC70_08840, partial [Chitinispirillales bacterium]|nr:hypothetical protein [Chitinispirillales bacterium]
MYTSIQDLPPALSKQHRLFLKSFAVPQKIKTNIIIHYSQPKPSTRKDGEFMEDAVHENKNKAENANVNKKHKA